MKYRRVVGLLFTLSLILSVAAHAEEAPNASSALAIPIKGKFFTDVYAPSFSSSLNEFIEVSTSVWLELDQRVNEDSKAVLVFEANEISQNAATGAKDSFYGKLREAYAVYSKSGLELRAGQQIIPWGKSDGINPTDYLTAHDYTFFNWDDEVRRVGAVTGLVAWTPMTGNSPFTLTWAITPVFPKNTLLIGRQSIPAGVTLGAPLVPPTTPANAEAAFKTSYRGSGWDASLSAFHGFMHQPLYTVTPLGTLNPTFQRETALGGDGSFTSGAWILRGESAYFFTDSPGNTLAVEPSHWETVLGAERPLGDRFRIQAQGYAKLIPNYPQNLPPSPLDPVSNFNALIGNYQDAFRLSSTLRVTYTSLDEAWEVELFNVFNFMGSDSFTRLRITHPLTDALRLTLGADANAGPPGRTFGALQDFSAIFGEAKYAF